MSDAPDAGRTVPSGEAARPADRAAGRPDARSGESAPGASPEGVMGLLADHVPLALLMDLVTPEGPASADILRAEGIPEDAWWEPEDEAEPEPADGPAAPLGTDPASDEPEAIA